MTDAWRSSAACRGSLLDWFASEDEPDYQETLAACRQVCGRCPVFAECRKWALTQTTTRVAGVLAGMSEHSRERARKNAMRRALGPAQLRGQALAAALAKEAAEVKWAASRTPKAPALTPIQHGTNAGYDAHVRRKVPPCQPCREAHAVYWSYWKRSQFRATEAM